jgi:hypothetical protein
LHPIKFVNTDDNYSIAAMQGHPLWATLLSAPYYLAETRLGILQPPAVAAGP